MRLIVLFLGLSYILTIDPNSMDLDNMSASAERGLLLLFLYAAVLDLIKK